MIEINNIQNIILGDIKIIIIILMILKLLQILLKSLKIMNKKEIKLKKKTLNVIN